MTDPLTGLRAEMAAFLRESPLLEGIAVRERVPGRITRESRPGGLRRGSGFRVERAAAPGDG